MKTYMGAVYGVRHYTLGPSPELPGFLMGATGRKWYSPRQKARCDFYGEKRLPSSSLPPPLWKNWKNVPGTTPRAKVLRDVARDGDFQCPHKHHRWAWQDANSCIELAQALCGINMYNTLVIPGANRRRTLTGVSFRLRTPGDAHAITKGWGKIIVHADGYRVEQALVTHLYVPDETLSIREMQRADLPYFLPGFVKRNVTFVDTLEEFEEAWKNVSNLLVPIPASESR